MATICRRGLSRSNTHCRDVPLASFEQFIIVPSTHSPATAAMRIEQCCRKPCEPGKSSARLGTRQHPADRRRVGQGRVVPLPLRFETLRMTFPGDTADITAKIIRIRDHDTIDPRPNMPSARKNALICSCRHRGMAHPFHGCNGAGASPHGRTRPPGAQSQQRRQMGSARSMSGPHHITSVPDVGLGLSSLDCGPTTAGCVSQKRRAISGSQPGPQIVSDQLLPSVTGEDVDPRSEQIVLGHV